MPKRAILTVQPIVCDLKLGDGAVFAHCGSKAAAVLHNGRLRASILWAAGYGCRFLHCRFIGEQKQHRMAQTLVCTECGQVGKGKNFTKGSMLIEAILWLCFLIPGLIYSIWRLTTRHKVCSVCGKSSLIPADSPRGRKLLEEHDAALKTSGGQAEASPARPFWKSKTFIWIALGIILVWVFLTGLVRFFAVS